MEKVGMGITGYVKNPEVLNELGPQRPAIYDLSVLLHPYSESG